MQKRQSAAVRGDLGRGGDGILKIDNHDIGAGSIGLGEFFWIVAGRKQPGSHF